MLICLLLISTAGDVKLFSGVEVNFSQVCGVFLQDFRLVQKNHLKILHAILMFVNCDLPYMSSMLCLLSSVFIVLFSWSEIIV